jgi:hypothetical protein|mmetsp:Transcript_14126/g.46842  ORF Transcript_14126/g.46842 Transcript_14126/m.46842 type:complete len:279 (-) Transcript_14126:1093-1929(-)
MLTRVAVPTRRVPTGGPRVPRDRTDGRFVVTSAAAARDDGKLKHDTSFVHRDGTAHASGSKPFVGPLTAFAVATALSMTPPAFAATPMYSGVNPDESPLVRRLRENSDKNKDRYDQQRLDNYYQKDFAINKLLGKELLPEPCDPRDPEFASTCGSEKVPRLPQSRTDPFDDRSLPNASRRGAIVGLNDLNIEDEAGFGDGNSNSNGNGNGELIGELTKAIVTAGGTSVTSDASGDGDETRAGDLTTAEDSKRDKSGSLRGDTVSDDSSHTESDTIVQD